MPVSSQVKLTISTFNTSQHDRIITFTIAGRPGRYPAANRAASSWLWRGMSSSIVGGVGGAKGKNYWHRVFLQHIRLLEDYHVRKDIAFSCSVS